MTDLQFFLTKFWQNIFAKEMWRNVKTIVSEAIWGFIVFRYTPNRSPEKSISLSDIAYFAVRLSLFQGAKWCFSASEMGSFASRNGAYCNARKCSLNINHWYSIHYKNLLFFAYLRPTKSLSANTRLFFGVEWETKTEKSKSGYDLKVVHIVFISAGESNAYPGLKPPIFDKSIIIDFYWF